MGAHNTWFHGPPRVHIPKRHLDRFMRFSTGHVRDQQSLLLMWTFHFASNTVYTCACSILSDKLPVTDDK